MKSILAILLLACGLQAQTTTHGMTIPTTHPRLWFDSTRLATAQSWYTTHPITTYTDSTNGNSQYMQRALRGLLAPDPTACRAAIDWLVAYNPAGQSNANAADWMRYHGEQANMVWDWCYSGMTSGERASIITKINAWYDLMESLANFVQAQNNYFRGYLRNEIEWAIVSYEENTTKAEAYLTFAETRLARLATVDPLMVGGTSFEGLQYGAYPPWYDIVPFETARLLGRDIWATSNWWKENIFAVIYNTLPGDTTTINGVGSGTHTGKYQFPWNDDQFFQQGGHSIDGTWGDTFTNAATKWGSVNVGKYAQQWLNDIGPTVSQYTASVAVPATPRAFSNLPLDYYAAGAGTFIVRKAWDSTSTVVKIQLRNLKTLIEHTHDDFGWQVWRNGRWLSRETTGYGDVIKNFNGTGNVLVAHTPGHNGVLFNGYGLGQTSGCTTSCMTSPRNGQPTITRLESAAGYAYIAADLTEVYRNNVVDPFSPTRQNPSVKSIVQEYAFIRDIETTVRFYRLESNAVSPTAAADIVKTDLAHCEVAWTIVDANHATCTAGSQILRLTVLLPGTPNSMTSIDERGSTTVGQHRLEINYSGAAQSYFLIAMQASATSTTALTPTVTDNGTNYTLTLDGTHSMTLEKGMTSSGGSITIGGSTSSLRSTVQAMTVTDAGPSWGVPAFSIATNSLPSGVVGTSYSQTLVASGGSSPYTWTVSSGTLCVGLSLASDGTLNGTPTSSQTCSFTVQAQDATSATVTQPLVMDVTPNPAFRGPITTGAPVMTGAPKIGH